jgi:hypothetical protein
MQYIDENINTNKTNYTGITIYNLQFIREKAIHREKLLISS